MFSGIPNFVNSFGYINASWTLKADLTCEYACRLINYLDQNNYSHCVPRVPVDVKAEKDWLATEFSSGYIHRAIHLFPQQGSRSPCAFIELKDQNDSVSEGDIISFCKETLAGFKCPKKVVFTELPKTSTGKILKYELREMAKAADA